MAYRYCKFCQGKGCLACDGEAERDYKRAFPNGAQPIAVFKTNDPADMELARQTIGREAIEKAFGKGGGGSAEILENLKRVGKLIEPTDNPELD